MKICIISQTFLPQEEGGAEISSRHAAKNLSKLHNVVVLALGLAGTGDTEPGEQKTPANSAYRLFRIPFDNHYLPNAKRPNVGILKKISWHIRSAQGAVNAVALKEFFQREKFDVVYAQNCSRMQPVLNDVLADLGVPICQHLRDYALMCSKTSMYRKDQNCNSPCMQCKLLTTKAASSTSKVGTVIAVSEFVKRRFQAERLFPNANWHVLHNTNTAREDFAQELLANRPAPSDIFTVGYLGAISKEKGIEVLIAAARAIHSNLHVRFLLAGRGRADYEEHVKAAAKDIKDGTTVQFIGHVKPEVIFSQAEVMVVPSLWHEPQSRVLIEAATYGVPIFAANTGGSTEVVEGYKIGSVYSKDKSSELSNLINDAAKDGTLQWREVIKRKYTGLAPFDGTAEGTGFYQRLNTILEQAAGRAVS